MLQDDMSQLTNPLRQPRKFLLQLLQTAIQRAQAEHVLPAYLPAIPKGRTVVIGAGKATAAMALALEQNWPADAPLSGLVITRYGHTPQQAAAQTRRIEICEASHPVPDQAGLDASHRMLQQVQDLSSDDLVICLISGGGSALLTQPVAGLSLEALQQVNRQLLASGADIHEMNNLRKHLSRIKGGHLAARCQPARLLTLAISDVVGDDLSIIASGPTVADPGTCADALAVVEKYSIELPTSIRAQLESGALETPKPGQACFANSQAVLMATPQDALMAAAQAAQQTGIRAYILSDAIEGESREIARMHAALALSASRGQNSFEAPCVFISGGETTVTLTDPSTSVGKGGRNSEFCLALAEALQGHDGIWALAADTDGIDGSEDNAGAWVTPDTLARARQKGMDSKAFLAHHDAYSFFERLQDLVITGPSYTNVNDFRAILLV